MTKHYVWHDCDPGHDDAFALIYCLFDPEIELLGVSTVHGNQTAEKTYQNARRVLYIAGNGDLDIPVVQGASAPLVRPSRICPEIHGASGLGGIDWSEVDAQLGPARATAASVPAAIHAALEAVRERDASATLTLLVTGCHTNIAQYVAAFPGDVPHLRVVAMGGVFFERGNTGPWQEFNIHVDPEAFERVLASGAPVTLVPLDVTHTVRATDDVLARIAQLPGRFADVLTRLVRFFADTYRDVFGFAAPPVHDPVAAFFLTDPARFTTRTLDVAVETAGTHTAGALCARFFAKVSDGPDAGAHRPLTVCTAVDVPAFWDRMLARLGAAAARSPLGE